MFKKLLAFLSKSKTPRFVKTSDLANHVISQIDREMREAFKKNGCKVSLTEVAAIAKRAESLHERVRVTARLSPTSIYMARHTVHITETNQEWFTDNFIDAYKNPYIKK